MTYIELGEEAVLDSQMPEVSIVSHTPQGPYDHGRGKQDRDHKRKGSYIEVDKGVT